MKLRFFGKTVEISLRSNLLSAPAVQNDAAWQQFLAGAGVYVSADTALKVAAVIRCVDVVAKTMASLPLNLFKQTAEGKKKAEEHPVHKRIYRLPNKETTSFEFWLMYIYNLMLTKGAFAKIERDQNGFITALYNIPTRNCVLERNKKTGERYIDVWHEDQDQNRVLHERLYEGNFMFTPGTRFNSTFNPIDPINIARDVLGLSVALDTYASKFFENGANSGGIVTYPGSLTDTAYQRFKDSFYEKYSGVLNAHKVMFLEDGSKYDAIGKNPKDAQAIESRKHQVIEVCRIFGVPPHKAFEMDRITFNSIEQLNIEYVQEAIDPMAVRLEQTIYKDLLTAKEQKKYFAKFNVRALLRGDTKTQTEFYHMMRNDGVFSANNILELEDMNLIPEDKGGNEVLVNGNMIPLSIAKNNLPKAMLKGGSSGGEGNPNAGNGPGNKGD